MAVRAQDHEVVKLLVDFAANVNHRGASSTALTPLLAAVERGNLDLVELLISRGAEPPRVTPTAGAQRWRG